MAKDGMCFLMVGSAGYSNRGCEAIVRGTVAVLQSRFPDCRFIISSSQEDVADGQGERDKRLSHRPPRGLDWGADSKFRDPAWWTYRVFLRPFPALTYRYMHAVQYEAAQESVCALQVGGDNYTLDYGLPNWLLRLDEVLLSTGKPLILWGASIGPFAAVPGVEDAVRRHLKRFHLICARETATIAYLESLGVAENVRLVGDPAFLMPPDEPELAEELSTFLSQKPVGLNLSAYVGKFRTRNEGWEELATECVRRLAAEYGRLLLVPHVLAAGNDDHAFLAGIASKLGLKGQVQVVPRSLSAAQLKWVIARTRAFVGARTHSTIAGLSSFVPTISIMYSTKAKGINKDLFGHEEWVIPIDQVNPDTLLTRVRTLLSQEASVRNQLKEVVPVIQRRALAAADYVAELI